MESCTSSLQSLTPLLSWYPKKIVMRSLRPPITWKVLGTPATSACSISKPGIVFKLQTIRSSSQPSKTPGSQSPLHFNHSIHKLFHPLSSVYRKSLRIKFSAQSMIFNFRRFHHYFQNELLLLLGPFSRNQRREINKMDRHP